MPATALILPAVLGGVAAGILAGESVAVAQLPLLAGVGLTGIGLALRWRTWLVLGVALTAFGLGSWRSQAADPVGIGATSVATLVDGDDHEVVGTVVDDPRPREDRLQLVLGDLAIAKDGTVRSLSDRLLVWLPRGVDAGAGDRLLVTSRIELAEDFDGFAYREYLARQGIAAIARADSAEVVGEASGPTAVLAGLRSMLLGGLNDLVPEPEAALGAGILLGVRSAIAPEINDAFATAGLTHVVAISGWNIAIVAALVAAAVRPLARRPGGRWTTVGARGQHRRRLRPPHRGQPVRRPRRTHGRGDARRPPRGLPRPRGIRPGPGGARHAARRPAGALGRRVPALAARDGRPRLLRDVGRASPAPMAWLDS